MRFPGDPAVQNVFPHVLHGARRLDVAGSMLRYLRGLHGDLGLQKLLCRDNGVGKTLRSQRKGLKEDGDDIGAGGNRGNQRHLFQGDVLCRLSASALCSQYVLCRC